MQISSRFRNYLKDSVKIEFDGIDQSDGYIAEIKDEATGLIDEVLTIGNLVTIHGWGLKIDGEAVNQGDIGLWFDPPSGVPAGSEKAEIIAVNEPRTIKAIVPPNLLAGQNYTLRIVTQTSAKHAGTTLKNIRTMVSEASLLIQ